MPTVADLGRKVKAKYPGAYDDLTDADLGQRVQRKYPGAYDDFTPDSGSLLSRVTHGASDAVKGMAVGALAEPLAMASLQNLAEQESQPTPHGARSFNNPEERFRRERAQKMAQHATALAVGMKAGEAVAAPLAVRVASPLGAGVVGGATFGATSGGAQAALEGREPSAVAGATAEGAVTGATLGALATGLSRLPAGIRSALAKRAQSGAASLHDVLAHVNLPATGPDGPVPPQIRALIDRTAPWHTRPMSEHTTRPAPQLPPHVAETGPIDAEWREVLPPAPRQLGRGPRFVSPSGEVADQLPEVRALIGRGAPGRPMPADGPKPRQLPAHATPRTFTGGGGSVIPLGVGQGVPFDPTSLPSSGETMFTSKAAQDYFDTLHPDVQELVMPDEGRRLNIADLRENVAAIPKDMVPDDAHASIDAAQRKIIEGAQSDMRRVPERMPVHPDDWQGLNFNASGNPRSTSPGGTLYSGLPPQLVAKAMQETAQQIAAPEGPRIPGTRALSTYMRNTLGEHGKTLDDMDSRARNWGHEKAAALTLLHEEAGVGKLTDPEQLQVMLAREGKLDPAQTTPRVRASLAAWEATRRGLNQHGTASGTLQGAGYRSDWYPHRVLAPERMIAPGGEFTPQGKLALAYAQGRGEFPDAATTARMARSFAALKSMPETWAADPAAQGVDTAYAQHVADTRYHVLDTKGNAGRTLVQGVDAIPEGAVPLFADAGEAAKAIRQTSERGSPLADFLSGKATSGHLQARAINHPWIAGPNTALGAATHELTRVFGQAHAFGPKLEKLTAVLDQMPEAERRKAETLLQEYLTGEEGPMPGGKTVGNLMALNSMKNLGWRTYIKKSAAMFFTLMNADAHTFTEGWKFARTPEGQRWANSLGVVPRDTPEIVTGAGYDASAAIKKASNAFHTHGSHITGAVKRDRTTAAATGMLWLQKQAAVLAAKPHDRLARHELARFLTDKTAPDQVLAHGGLMPEQLRMGTLEFVRRSEPMPVAKDLPKWMTQTWIGRLASQYGHWEAGIGSNLGKATVDYARAGLPTRAARNAAVGLATTAAVGAPTAITLTALGGGMQAAAQSRTLRKLAHNQPLTREDHRVLSHLAVKAVETAPGIGPARRGLDAAMILQDYASGTLKRNQAADRLGELLPEGGAVIDMFQEGGAAALLDAADRASGKAMKKQRRDYWLKQIALARDVQGALRIGKALYQDAAR